MRWVLLGVLAGAVLSTAKTFRFIALGDFGCGGFPAGQVAEVSAAQHYHEFAEEFDAQFTISVGDNMYVDPNSGMRDSFEQTWVPSGTHGGGIWFPTRGNHDNHGPQMAYTNGHESKWYFPSTKYTREVDTGLGFTVQIWSIDTGDGSPAQLEWLKSSLTASKARWKIINTHYPFTNAGRHARVPLPVTIAKIAREYGAQIYFCGHDHIIQTSVNQGVVFVTTGAVARGAMMDRNILRQDSKFIFTLGVTSSVGAHGFMVLHASKNVMWGSVHGYGGMVDEFATVWDWPQRFSERGGNELPSPEIIRRYLAQEAKEAGPSPPPPPPPPATPTPPAPRATPEPPSPPKGNGECEVSKLVPPQGSRAECALWGTVADGTKCGLSTKAGGCGEAVCSAGTWQTPTACAEQLGEGMTPQGPKDEGVADRMAMNARFLVSTNCESCSGPAVGSRLTVWVQGINTAVGEFRAFLTYDDDLCTAGDTTGAIAGCEPRPLSSPLVEFLPQGVILAPTPVYICLSGNNGRKYHMIKDSRSHLPAFTLLPKQPRRKGGKGNAVVTRTTQLVGGKTEVFYIGGAVVFGIAAGVLWTRSRRQSFNTRPDTEGT
eukprot:Hpha_TRINITY_DN26220_c0_g1::TRINITY_DN26220_c0_g1_i1::g.184795::m.184795/K14379/ACP5; tartrate-resistant acid phosphatase type 5